MELGLWGPSWGKDDGKSTACTRSAEAGNVVKNMFAVYGLECVHANFGTSCLRRAL